MKNKYRIREGILVGSTVWFLEIKRWWFPFWCYLSLVSREENIYKLEEIARLHGNPKIREL